jgi:hypothetical protein
VRAPARIWPWLLLSSLAACALPAGQPCCKDDLECAAGARCFEGTCALRCVDDAECGEGEICAAVSRVCRSRDENEALSRCPYDEGRR